MSQTFELIFNTEDDFGGDEFQRDMERELDEISEEFLRSEPRPKPVHDATLKFDVIAETMVDLDEHGYVKKQVVTAGKGELPPPFARMVVHYDFYREGVDEPFDSTYLRGKPCRLRLDEGEMIPGLELALKSMQKLETSKFLFKHQVAFGSQGCPPRIPKNCDILAYVTVVDFSELVVFDEDVSVVDGNFKLTYFARAFKDCRNSHCEGNEEYGRRNYKAAVRCYRRCIDMLNEIKLDNELEENRVMELKVKCLVNLTICFNRLNKPQQACLTGKQALFYDHNNLKAIYQFSKANITLGNLEVAARWLTKARNLDSDDGDVNRLYAMCTDRIKNAKAKDLRFCKKALSLHDGVEEGEENQGTSIERDEEGEGEEQKDNLEEEDIEEEEEEEEEFNIIEEEERWDLDDEEEVAGAAAPPPLPLALPKLPTSLGKKKRAKARKYKKRAELNQN